MEVVLYTDASHCPRSKIAACGFVVLVDGKIIKHEVIMLEGLGTVGSAEVWIVIHALQYAFLLKGVSKIVLWSDYINITTFTGRAVERHSHYKELSETLEMIKDYGITVTLHHVKAHSQSKMNKLVDTSARKQLRKYLKSKV